MQNSTNLLKVLSDELKSIGLVLSAPNNLIVGYPWIPYLEPAPGSVVMSTAPTLTMPDKIDAVCSYYGAAILQCPHQGAKYEN